MTDTANHALTTCRDAAQGRNRQRLQRAVPVDYVSEDDIDVGYQQQFVISRSPLREENQVAMQIREAICNDSENERYDRFENTRKNVTTDILLEVIEGNYFFY